MISARGMFWQNQKRKIYSTSSVNTMPAGPGTPPSNRRRAHPRTRRAHSRRLRPDGAVASARHASPPGARAMSFLRRKRRGKPVAAPAAETAPPSPPMGPGPAAGYYAPPPLPTVVPPRARLRLRRRSPPRICATSWAWTRLGGLAGARTRTRCRTTQASRGDTHRAQTSRFRSVRGKISRIRHASCRLTASPREKDARARRERADAPSEMGETKCCHGRKTSDRVRSPRKKQRFDV